MSGSKAADKKYKEELQKTMLLCGAENINAINRNMIMTPNFSDEVCIRNGHRA
jgi:hypothetical protein